MPEERHVSPVVKQVLELGPPLIFLVVYFIIREDSFVIAGTEYSGFIVAALVFIPILLLAMGILWLLTGKLSRMQVFTAFMVIFFGGLTVYFNDESFVKIKTTIVWGLFAVLLGIGLLRGQSWLEFIMGDLVPMRPEGWMILTRRLCACFAALAIANEIVWRTMSNDAWVMIESFGFPIALGAFLMWQFSRLESYLITDEEDQA